MQIYSYVIGSILLILWCVLHSALISNGITEWMRQKAGRHYRFYRLFFNLFSLATFLPILYYFETLPSEMLFRWSGVLQVFQIGLIALSLYLFIAGARRYDAFQFLGLRQLNSNSNHKTLNESGKLNIAGLHQVIRHPWYSGSILIIWARHIDTSAIVQNIIMTLYLIIGTYLEERKLIIEFGQKYLDYQDKVSMLVPVKWVKAKLGNK